jgi:hypothetical protein
MSHRFDSLLLRGCFGAVLGLAAIVGATTHAVGLEGELVLHEGRLMLVPPAKPILQCALETERESLVDARTERSRG